MEAKKPARMVRIEYTVERRSGPVRLAKEVPVSRVTKTLDSLVEKHGAYNVDIRYEVESR